MIASITCTPVVTGNRRDDLAFRQESTLPTAAGVIAHAVHHAIANLKQEGISKLYPNTVFELKFENK